MALHHKMAVGIQIHEHFVLQTGSASKRKLKSLTSAGSMIEKRDLLVKVTPVWSVPLYKHELHFPESSAQQ